MHFWSIKRTLTAGLIAAAVALSACSGATTTKVVVSDVITTVQTTCGFIPTATSIAALFTADPALATASQAATFICQAFEAQKVAGGKLSQALHTLRAGEQVSFVVDVNGQAVTITGTTK